jgi:hypothetical protein
LSRRREIAELINRQKKTEAISADINVSFRIDTPVLVFNQWIVLFCCACWAVFSGSCLLSFELEEMNKSLYSIVRHNIDGRIAMTIESEKDEIRWQVLKSMLEEFPQLKEKTRKYLKENNRKQK